MSVLQDARVDGETHPVGGSGGDEGWHMLGWGSPEALISKSRRSLGKAVKGRGHR